MGGREGKGGGEASKEEGDDLASNKIPGSTTVINKVHVLVCVCPTTSLDRAHPFMIIDSAQLIAEGLLTLIFARFGSVEKLYYDQQSGLMPDLMQIILKLLRVHSEVAVANCHKKTAIAERKIRTVEQVLRSYVFQYTGRLTCWKNARGVFSHYQDWLPTGTK
jgi:hypothetical protein